MNCKSCNTRIPAVASHCPNCGLVCGGGASASNVADPELSGPAPLSPSTATEAIDLEEIAKPAKKSNAKAPVSASKAKTTASASKAKTTPANSDDSQSRFGFTPRVAELRALLAEQPQLLEQGMSVYKEKGKATGENFETSLGNIDLLAKDDGGALVVILIAANDSKDIVTDMLGRIGWVRKHLAESGQEVRGIVLAESMPEGVEYTAAAVADTVSFKIYQVALTFNELDF